MLKNTQFPNSVEYLDIERLEKNITRQYVDRNSSVIANDNDLFIVWDGSRSGLVHKLEKGKEGAVASTIMRITPIGVNKNYLFYFLQYQYEFFQQNTVGDTIPHINPKLFYDLDVYVPPIQEQERIVIELEKKLSEYQKQFNDNQQELEKLETYRQSVLESAISGELTEGWREENNVEFDWESKILDKITVSITDGKHGNAQDEENSGYYFISAKDIVKGSIIYENARQISFYDFQEIHRRTNFEVDDLCIVNTGTTIGKTAIGFHNELAQKTTFQKSVAIVKPIKTIVKTKFLDYFIRKNIIEIRDNAQGAAIQNLLIRDIKSLNINLPSLFEQTEIVNRVEKLLKKADEAEAKYNQAMKMIDKLQASVLAMAFCGELSESQPNDESVSVLLEKIKTEKARLEQERQELQKSQTQIKRTMGKPKKEKKSIVEVIKNSSNPELTIEDCYHESGQATPAAFFKDLRNNLALLDIQKSFEKPEGEVKIKLKAQ